MKQELLSQIIPILGVFLASLVSILLSALIVFIKAKISKLKLETNNILKKSIFDKIEIIIVHVIEELRLKGSEKIRKITEDGVIEEKEIDELVKFVKNIVMKELGEEGIKELKQLIGDVEKFIERHVKLFLSNLQKNG